MMSVDMSYVRGWDDCLDTVDKMIVGAKDTADLKQRVQRLRELVRQNKFKKIRNEFGAFEFF